MDRLTFDGNFCDIAMCRELPCPYGGSCSQKEVWERLKEYEDTGYSAFDIRTMNNELCDRCGNSDVEYMGACDGCMWRIEDDE